MERPIALSHGDGLVAEAVLERLSESGYAPDSLLLLGSEADAGKRIAYGDTRLVVADQGRAELSECAMLLLLAQDPQLEAAAVQQGCLVVSHAIDDAQAALFMAAGGAEPELSYSASRLRLAGPEAACLLPALTALDRLAGIASVNLTLLRSAEFHGKAGVEELASQTVNLLNSRPIEPRVFAQQIAFNLLPHRADPAIAADIAALLGAGARVLDPHSVDVPLFHGFAAAVSLEFESAASLDACRQCLAGVDGADLKSAQSSPIFDCNQSFGCAISHLQQASGNPANLQFWIIADPLRYGLANNYVNVVDFLLKSFL